MLVPQSTLFLLCDIQTKFKNAIFGYQHVVSTANKMVKIAQLLGIPVIATTQNSKALGQIDPGIDLASLGSLLLGNFDKTLFSMITQDVENILASKPEITQIVLFGIESHVCVLQTFLSLSSLSSQPNGTKYTIHILADGISSCNSFEVSIAIARMRHEGAVITTSESVGFQLVGDAKSDKFKAFSKLVKEEQNGTKSAGEYLLQDGKETPDKLAPVKNIKNLI
ncbi:Isochorismatase-like protein [Crepidotus variabilis]|uniref:Isochorismatase-like protein n=1 Tax=Crepidotus variabilis TaxID=179855 RepID=A0A9P6ETS4_9AGAR|nr:Isochorismatase-like protein [Crepidotus variabilis]